MDIAMTSPAAKKSSLATANTDSVKNPSGNSLVSQYSNISVKLQNSTGSKIKLPKYLKTKNLAKDEIILSTSGFMLLRFQIPCLSMTFSMASPTFPHLNFTFVLLMVLYMYMIKQLDKSQAS